MLFSSEDLPAPGLRKKLWLNYAAIAALITASTIAILFCPCDCIGQNLKAVALVFISSAFGLAAAALVFRGMALNNGVTAFLKAVAAIAFVAAGIYAELTIAFSIIAWLAAHGRSR